MTTFDNIDHNVISFSGGKDSTAMLLLAIERDTPDLSVVFADTGNEHEQTGACAQWQNPPCAGNGRFSREPAP